MRHRLPKLLAAASLAATLSACGASTPRYIPAAPVLPSLPVAPQNFGKEVPAPRLAEGMDTRVALARTLGALRTANERLKADRQFYLEVECGYSRTADPQLCAAEQPR